jgi:predicted permease
MGCALAESIFGSSILLNVMMFTLPLSMYVYTYGYCILTKSPLRLKKLLNPITIAIFSGMIVGISGLKLPEFISGFLNTAAAPMGIASMLLTGITISQYKFKELVIDKTNYIVILLRLLVFPISIAYILKSFVSADVAVISLLAYAMPCGLNTVVFPKLIGEDCRTGASLAMISSFLSIITIPICMYLFT